MRADLQDLVFERWPELYKGAEDNELRTVEFEHGSGWYPLVDVLSEVVQGLAREAGQTVPQVCRSKEKFGNLRFSLTNYPEDPDVQSAMFAAIDFADAISGTVCEDTGRPGAMWSLGGWYRTMSIPAIRVWQQERQVRTKATAKFIGKGLIGQTSNLLYQDEQGGRAAETWNPALTEAFVKDTVVSIPIGYTDIANTLLRTLAYGGYQQPARRMVQSLGWVAETQGFAVELQPDVEITPAIRAVIRMATLLARRVDTQTGSYALPDTPAP